MRTRIDEYLENLAGLLAKRLPLDKRNHVLGEVRSHLVMAVQDRVEQGKSEEAAAVEALNAFGDVRDVAQDLIHQHTGVNRRSSFKLVRVPILFTSLSMVIGSATVLVSYRWITDIHFVSEACLICSLLAFAIAVVRSRRWLVLPFAIGSFAVSCIVGISMSTWIMVGTPEIPHYPEEHLMTDADLKKDIVSQEQDLDYARRAYREAISGTAIETAALHEWSKKQIYVPYLTEQQSSFFVWGISVPMPPHQLGQISSLEPNEDARALWRADGALAIKSMEDRLEFTKNEVFHGSFGRILVQTVSGLRLLHFAVNTAVLALINWMLLVFAGVLDAFRRLRRRALA